MYILASRSNLKPSAVGVARSATSIPSRTDAVVNDQQWGLTDNGERHETTSSVSRYHALASRLPTEPSTSYHVPFEPHASRLSRRTPCYWATWPRFPHTERPQRPSKLNVQNLSTHMPTLRLHASTMLHRSAPLPSPLFIRCTFRGKTNQGFGDNMDIYSACAPNHQLVVPTADLFAAPPADSSEGAAELCASPI